MMHASVLVKWCLVTFDALWFFFWVLPFSRISMDILGVRCPPAKPMPRPAMPMPALEAIGPPSTRIWGGPCMKHLEYKKHAQWLTTKKATTTTTLSRSRRRERMITTCKAPILNHQQEDICDYVWRSKPPVLSRPRFSKALWTWRTTW